MNQIKLTRLQQDDRGEQADLAGVQMESVERVHEVEDRGGEVVIEDHLQLLCVHDRAAAKGQRALGRVVPFAHVYQQTLEEAELDQYQLVVLVEREEVRYPFGELDHPVDAGRDQIGEPLPEHQSMLFAAVRTGHLTARTQFGRAAHGAVADARTAAGAAVRERRAATVDRREGAADRRAVRRRAVLGAVTADWSFLLQRDRQFVHVLAGGQVRLLDVHD